MKLYRYYTLNDVKDKILSKDWQCWVYVPKPETIRCVWITHISKYPTGYKVLTVLMAGGSGANEWKSYVLDHFKAYAKDRGCGELCFSGRKGWAKVLNVKPQSTYSVEI